MFRRSTWENLFINCVSNKGREDLEENKVESTGKVKICRPVVEFLAADEAYEAIFTHSSLKDNLDSSGFSSQKTGPSFYFIYLFIYSFIYNCIVPLEFLPWEFGLLSPGKASCDRVALHLRWMLGVFVLPYSTEL